MIQILNECHEFSDTIKYFMPFFTTYLCETAFLLYTMTNTKYRNKLAQNMGSAVANYKVTPDLNNHCQGKQVEPFFLDHLTLMFLLAIRQH